MQTEGKLQESLKKALGTQLSTIPVYLLDLAYDAVGAAIPREFNGEMHAFAKVVDRNESGESLREEKAALELGLLVANHLLYDMIVSVESSRIDVIPLDPTLIVTFHVFRSTFDEEKRVLAANYRSELKVSNGRLEFAYTAEGNRRLVQSLANYGISCLHAIYALNAQG